MKRSLYYVIAAVAICSQARAGERDALQLDVGSRDILALPAVTAGAPDAGKRVAVTPPEYAGTNVFHTLYLPQTWKSGGERLPIIFEYTGNEFPKAGSTGEPEDAGLGYGLSGGKYIWVSLPYISRDGTDNAVTWWGDEAATIDYAKRNVPRIIKEFNADPDAVFLCGFSRGAIGVNYLGLHDDEISRFWTAFITHDHFDGVKEWRNTTWGTPLDKYRAGARKRLRRVGNRPYLVSQNGRQDDTEQYVRSVLADIDNFTFSDINTREILGEFPNDFAVAGHNDRWPLKPSEHRSKTWAWMNRAVATVPGEKTQPAIAASAADRPAPLARASRSKPNILLICIDDLRPELNCFGASYIHSPNIDRIAATGTVFRSHYVQAPTCGASRYTLLTGRYFPAGNGALFQRAAKMRTEPDSVPPSMPAWFREHGYTTVSVGKVSHHPGGLGGKDWDDPNQREMPDSWDRHVLPAGSWRHPRGWMHGLANGEIRVKAGDMDVFQALDGPDSIYPDGISMDEAIRQMDQLTANPNKPFFLAVGILRPHLPFGAPAKYLKPYADVNLPPTPHPTKPAGRTTWHGSNEFMKYNRWKRNPISDADFAVEVRKHYAACVSYADAQVGRLMERLAKSGAADHTIVVVWGDHGWHLGEHSVWGKHTLFEESLRSPLIVSTPDIGKPGESTNSMVETLDVFPTLCELAGVPTPDFVHGVSLRPLLDNPGGPGHAAIAYHGSARTIRTETHRLILHKDGYAELYDHTSSARETQNIAKSNPSLVMQLTARLVDRLAE